VKLTAGKLAAIGASAAMLAFLAGPAFGAGVDVLYSSNGGSRTLSLYEPDGTTPLTSTDLSSGTSNFIAKVQDNGYTNNGFTVQATMSNLYSYASSTNTYNCNSYVPSNAISLSSPTGMLSVAGVNANLTPVFTVVGTLTPTNTPGLTSTVSVNNTIDGLLPASQNPLSQAQLTGSSATNLFGSTLATLGGDLPVNLDTTGLGGTFTNPDVHPTCDTTATGATPVQIMSGTADPTGLLTAVQNVIGNTLGAGVTDPTLTQLISAGYLTSSQVSTMLQGISGLVSGLGLPGITSDLTTIEGILTAAVSSVTALPGSIIQSGTYSSSPDLAINTSGIPAGSYKGVMTVTLLDK
jgi:hypothetical protein